jgi:hypothetical protein
MNCVTLDCSAGVGCVGYCAAMEWRRVQDERPSCSTSGGQSLGGCEGDMVPATPRPAARPAAAAGDEDFVVCFA